MELLFQKVHCGTLLIYFMLCCRKYKRVVCKRRRHVHSKRWQGSEMNSLILAVLLSLTVFTSGFIVSTNVSRSFDVKSECSENSSSGDDGAEITTRSCFVNATKKIDENGSCFVYNYNEVKVTKGPVPSNNGVPKCTKLPWVFDNRCLHKALFRCNASTTPEQVDCKTVFGNDDMSEINKKREQ